MRTAVCWRLARSALLLACAAVIVVPAGERVTLDDVRHAMRSARQARVELVLSAIPGSVPPHYAIFDPPRIVVDLPGVTRQLAQKTLIVDAGLVDNVTAVEVGGRTRVVIKLARMVPYEIRTEGQSIYVTMGAK